MPKFIAQRDVLLQVEQGCQLVKAGDVVEFSEAPVSKNKARPNWVAVDSLKPTPKPSKQAPKAGAIK